MKKFINEPKNFVDDMLEGILMAHPDQLAFTAGDKRCIIRAGAPRKGKVGIATGGGSGHLPLFLGYVGQGMLDGCSVGGVFQSPSSEQMLNVTKAIHGGAGVLYIYGNYGGDIMNFDMAKDMASMDNIRVEQVVGAEDVASAPKGQEGKRRGVAGIFFLYKCAGAMAETKASLDEVKRVAEKAAANVRTMGVALSPNIVPEVGKPQFSLGENEMEIGMGIHGEPGIRRGPLKKADDIVQEMMEPVLKDLPFSSGDKVAVLINGLGATPKEEMYVLYRKVGLILKEKKISVYHVYVGEFATSLEMAGASISLLKLDDELTKLLAKPAHTPFFEQVQL
ncbi:MAG: dihydroxyacetone kinase subunit DhaK [Spirochaetia bacterium]|jgi:dihydroxyacetone kinase-like protein